VDSGYLNLKKRYRLALRTCICIIFLCLPLKENLNSLQLIGTVTALLWFVLAVETWGNAEKCHVWIGDKSHKKYVCKLTNYECEQGQEPLVDELDSERRDDEGDISFSV